MPRPTREEVRTKLSSFGKKIENFNQNDSDRSFPKSTELSDGYCEGVTLDWIRRVLQGGRPSFGPKLIQGQNPDHSHLLKIQAQAARQSNAYLNWRTTKEKFAETKQGRLKEAANKFNAIHDQKIAELDSLEDYLLETINSTSQSVISITPKAVEQIKALYGKNVGVTHDRSKLVALYRSLSAKRTELIEEGKMTPELNTKIELAVLQDTRRDAWKDFASKSDQDTQKKRKFGSVALTNSTPTRDVKDLSQVLEVLLYAGDRLQNSAAIKVNIGGTQNGKDFFHSTASYLSPGGKYLFLDPNYGIFEYPEWKMGVMKAIAYLYRDVYSWESENVSTPISAFKVQIEMFAKEAAS